MDRLVAVGILLLLTGVFVFAGIAYFMVSALCEEDCYSTLGRMAWSAFVMTCAVLPLSPAVALLLRRSGGSAENYGSPAAPVAALLTVYWFAVGAIAYWLGSERVIVGNAYWAMFWVLAVAAWGALLGAVIRRLETASRQKGATLRENRGR